MENIMSQLNIGTKIKKLRMTKGLNQTELANALSVSNSTISNWENGHRLPSIEELHRVSTFFDTSLGYFDPNGQPESISSEQDRSPKQRIEYARIGYVVNRNMLLLFMSSTVIIVLAYFMPAYLEFPVFALGASGLAGIAFFHVMHVINHRNLNTRSVVIPLEDDVHYVHVFDDDKMKKIEKTSRLLHIALLILSLIVYGLFVLSINRIGSIWSDLLVSFYAVIGITVSSFRYLIIHKKNLFSKSIPYHEANKNLKYVSFPIGFYIDAVMFGFLVLVAIINKGDLLDDSLMLLTLILATAYLWISYFIFIGYGYHVGKYEICAMEKNGNMRRLF